MSMDHPTSLALTAESQRAGKQVMCLLILGVLAVTVLSLIANVMWMSDTPFARKAMLLFDVDQEKSVATWWSATTLAGLGVLTWIVGQRSAKASFGDRIAWGVLALGFVFLSVDESCMIHERIGGKIQLDGPLTYARWIIVWLPLAGIFAGFVFWKLWRNSKRTVVGLIIGAAVFLTGAVGTEIINSQNRYSASRAASQHLEATDFEETQPLDRTGKENYAYVAGVAVEEFLEMSGVLVWFFVMLRVDSTPRKPEELQAKSAVGEMIESKEASRSRKPNLASMEAP